MTPIIEDAILGSDLDAKQFSLLNLAGLDPIPANLVQSDNPGLTDSRIPLDGSVTNASVAGGAAIDQSKLNLDGDIPPAWLGTAAGTAAQGDLAEYLSNKNQPNGYCGLNAGGKVAAAQLPGTAGSGTVTSVGLQLPLDFAISGSPVTAAGIIHVAWENVGAASWFGNPLAVPGNPHFINTPLPISLIPDFDTAQVTSGIFDPALLPVAVGLGVSHAPGIAPDPGDGSGGALATDYLARDMSYKPVPAIGPAYQPTIPDPTFGISPNLTGPVMVTAISTIKDVIFFYSLTSAATGFAEFPEAGYVSLPGGDSIWVYAAHPGYNNSNVVTMTNSNPP